MIVAFDFFTVSTLTFQLLYCFFVIEHGRRRVPHFNITRHPTAEWVVQQLREAFPEAGRYRYAILDHDQAMFTGRKNGFGSSLVAKPGKRGKKKPSAEGESQRLSA